MDIHESIAESPWSSGSLTSSATYREFIWKHCALPHEIYIIEHIRSSLQDAGSRNPPTRPPTEYHSLFPLCAPPICRHSLHFFSTRRLWADFRIQADNHAIGRPTREPADFSVISSLCPTPFPASGTSIFHVVNMIFGLARDLERTDAELREGNWLSVSR